MSQPVAVDFGRGVEDAFARVIEFVPKLIVFVIILIVGVIVARILARLVNTVLERVGFDRAVERGGVSKALSRSKYDASDIVAKIVYYAVLLFTLQLAFGIFGQNPISALITSVIAFLPKLLVGIIIVVVAAAIASAVKDLVSGALGGLSYGKVVANIASIFILALGIIAALNQIGIATTVTTPVLVAVLATLAGVVIVGVGGGLVRPMEQRWHGWLDKAEQESTNAKAQIEANRAAGNVSAGIADKARAAAGSSGESSDSGSTTTYAPSSGTTYGTSSGSTYGESSGGSTYGGSTGGGATQI